ncbi:protoheme IX farnesyltransferase [Herbidospora galbida]|uniref:Protoheme IX farnesyltransferase n=1 Tax=Herbidospora galbida TaxID=2575442 RepID=A0A4U3M5I5_9ACTN|nr:MULTISPECIES: heme o synthase [Herbidospora]TKK84145.1 protoheme IX farnesyltransferase [Herbidospora galbida]
MKNEAMAPAAVRRGAGEVIRAYVALTKPRIIELLLITTLPVMFLAAKGLPDLWLAINTMVFGTLSAGSANALNCYIDRDIDEVMRRTRRRPLARHTVSPRGALTFGVILGAASTLGLGLTVNWLAAALSLGAILFYVLVYSMFLKRRTSQNIVWGGIAGCMPVLIGWAGITGGMSWAPVVLFGVVFFWTPPHTWTLAMRYREDYAAAKVPMLPTVASEATVVKQVIWYTWATVVCSLLLWPVAGTSLFYPAVAAVLGAACLFEVYALRHRLKAGKTGVDLRPMRFFHWSNIYLALLFLAVAIDSLIA